MEKIKLQVRDKEGQLLAYNNDCQTIENAIRIKNEYAKMYEGFVHIISINFINPQSVR